MGSPENEQDYEKKDGPAKMVRVVLHTVFLPCVLGLMALTKKPHSLQNIVPPHWLSLQQTQCLKGAVWISCHSAVLILSFPREQQRPGA